MKSTMKERQAITKMISEQYRRATKKGKGVILDQFVESTGYNRLYAARLLRHHGKRVEVAPGRVLEGSIQVKAQRPPREPTYGPEVLKPLKKIWKIMDFICGKRLAAVMPELVPCLIRHGELRVNRCVREKLLQISPATIDRLLVPERKKAQLKGRSRTKPGTLLKHQIPVRTFSGWEDAAPGFLEIDLVAQDGGSGHGEYCQILDATDVCTGWSEQYAVPTKAQCFVFDAIQEIRRRLPFALLGLDSDNGGEFINHHLKNYCEEEKITFTRGRACKKNDNCYVEQKNWSIVRRFSGYGRFEGEAACAALNELYDVVRDYVNFFMPSMKLLEKVRDGAKVTKRYDTPQTPYRRVLASPKVSMAGKNRLKRRYAALNPAGLKREIERLQKQLLKMTVRPGAGTSLAPTPSAKHPWRAGRAKEKTG